MEKMIEIKNVSLEIKKVKILDSISITINQGTIVGLIGRNGCGKTVLMKCICGFMHPTEGEVLVKGKKIGTDCDFPANTGIIIETPEFIPYYTGYQNLKRLADLKHKIGKERVIQTMKQVGLDPALKRPVKKYSLGMRQRLGLAQAIMEDPDILILDEPMNGLDREGVADMRQYLLDLKKQGKTVVLASHSREDIAILCDVTYQLDHGRLCDTEE